MSSKASSQPGQWRRRVGLAMLALGAALTVLMAVSAKWWFGYSTEAWLADLGDGTLYTQTITPSAWGRPLVGWCGGENPTYVMNGTPRSWTWTWWTWGARKNAWEEGHAYTVWPVDRKATMLQGASGRFAKSDEGKDEFAHPSRDRQGVPSLSNRRIPLEHTHAHEPHWWLLSRVPDRARSPLPDGRGSDESILNIDGEARNAFVNG
jgi:hypothetical protein